MRDAIKPHSSIAGTGRLQDVLVVVNRAGLSIIYIGHCGRTPFSRPKLQDSNSFFLLTHSLTSANGKKGLVPQHSFRRRKTSR